MIQLNPARGAYLDRVGLERRHAREVADEEGADDEGEWLQEAALAERHHFARPVLAVGLHRLLLAARGLDGGHDLLELGLNGREVDPAAEPLQRAASLLGLAADVQPGRALRDEEDGEERQHWEDGRNRRRRAPGQERADDELDHHAPDDCRSASCRQHAAESRLHRLGDVRQQLRETQNRIISRGKKKTEK